MVARQTETGGSAAGSEIPVCGGVRQERDQKGVFPHEWLWVASVSAKNVDLVCVWSRSISWLQKPK